MAMVMSQDFTTSAMDLPTCRHQLLGCLHAIWARAGYQQFRPTCAWRYGPEQDINMCMAMHSACMDCNPLRDICIQIFSQS